MKIEIKETKKLKKADIIELYESLDWSSAKKPDELYKAILNSASVITAWYNKQLIGLANALSDGFLVVYYPHFLVHPDYQGKGVGKAIMTKMFSLYSGFHQQVLVSEKDAVDFYKKCGFNKASDTVPLWIYDGDTH